MGTLNGIPSHECSIETTIEGKPWLKPGADNTDYCSYGFNESRWLAYYERQRKMHCNESLVGMANGDSYNKLRLNLVRDKEYYASRVKKKLEDRAYEQEREGRNRYRERDRDVGNVNENVIATGNVVETERVMLKVQKQAIMKKGNINTSLVVIVLKVVVMKNIVAKIKKNKSEFFFIFLM
jgi:hypothetical protein